MNEPLDDQYFTWLYSQVASLRQKNPNRTYWDLLRQMYRTEFFWFVENDDNRVEDGRDLRYEFFEENGLHDVDKEWVGLGCSFLEMLLGLSHRLAFEVGEGNPKTWFWHLVDNLGLSGYSDSETYSEETVNDILQTVMLRTYKPSGEGGLFPLHNPHEDQREIEIWYQLSAYVIEQGF